MRDGKATATQVQALFLHDRLVSHLDPRGKDVVEAELRAASLRLPSTAAARAYVLEDVVAAIYDRAEATELAVGYASGGLTEGQVVTTTQRFYFRREPDGRRCFHAPLDVDKDVTVSGVFSEDRCVGTTGRDLLSGSKRVTMLAFVVATCADEIVLQPLFMGSRYFTESEQSTLSRPQGVRELHAQLIDQFREMSDVAVPTPAQLRAMSTMPEADVKAAFAEILGEPFVPKDWGGENSDLCTHRITVDGVPSSAAFAFKGPGIRGTLRLRDMGKNGDQGLRLFNEPVQIVVVQHHGAVDSAVRRLLDAFARQHGKEWMVLDGATTASILLAYDHLPEV